MGPLFSVIELGLKGWDKLIVYPDVNTYLTETDDMKYENGLLTVKYTWLYYYGEWDIRYQICDDATWTSVGALPADFDLMTYESEADDSHCDDTSVVDYTYMVTDVYRTNSVNVLWDLNMPRTF